ncbi:helix-turn-helix transcriptional regulator [Nocardia uniformis]|uniref:Helix-turn-helix transcriptional regulator n=1 Tax=Nocardia uniformis TaxID=53432 RepID=A0A849C6X4_9NOCA|nr:helix-turn-helix transcriptional regulator [Nocardia uniformis]NNH73486.1 helix-turn-helix transcriptional regulator [Nocardia uniformis]
MVEERASREWESSEFRMFLAQGQPGQALALVRRARGLSQADFGALLHWDRAHVGRVERGDVDTLFDIRQLIRVATALGIPRSALAPALLGTTGAGTIESGVGEGVDDVDRRQFGLAASLAIAGSAMPGPMTTETLQVGDDHITYLRTLTRQLWDHDNRLGGGSIADFALRQYRRARTLLDYGDYGNRAGVQLVAETGRLCSCAGWLAYDNGQPDLARWCYTEAVLLAEQTSDTEMLAAALGGLSIIATEQPTKSHEPVRLALRVSELASTVPSSRLNALRAARESIAHAAIGDGREFDRATTRVRREMDRGIDDPNDPVWLSFVTEPELRVHEAKGNKMLGRHHRAVDLYRESVARDDVLPRDRASYHAYFAASLAGLGEIRSAVAEAHTALSLLEGPVSSPRLVAELRPVRSAVANARGDDVERFRLRFDALTRAA